METMVNEEGLTFKELEKKIYSLACRWARDYARGVLEAYDERLAAGRDKKAYRDKGLRKTVVKTVFGEVEYRRHVYQTTREDGFRECVYLLDEQLGIARVGKISQNMAEQLISGITDMSYRDCASHVSENTGQAISPMGVWNVVQALGEKVCEEEKELVKAHKEGKVRGGRTTPVLFEEIDGVYLPLQREAAGKAELKVALAYDGWKEESKGRYTLDGKVSTAGFSTTREFREYTEAAIAEKYNTDEIRLRVFNGDGAGWIKKSCAKDAVFQLDIFHRNKAIRENIPYSRARKAIYEYLGSHDTAGMFEYLGVYRDSLSDDGETEKAQALIDYFRANEAGLVPWYERGMDAPPHEGLSYRGMGTMENHIWSIIARRMKHRHASWSLKGGNNLAKILAKKGCGRLGEVADRLKTGRFDTDIVEEIECGILSCADIPKSIGHGYEYPVPAWIPASCGSSGSNSRRLWNNIKGI